MMKKLLLLLLALAAFSALKAQQFQNNLVPLKPFKIPQQLKIDTSLLLKSGVNSFNSVMVPNLNNQLLAQLTPLSNNNFVDKMPVLHPNMSGFKMPVVKTEKPGEHFTMPIAGFVLPLQPVAVNP